MAAHSKTGNEYGRDARSYTCGRHDLVETNPDGIYSGSMKRVALQDGKFLPEASTKGKARSRKS